jgi:DNA-binding MarR family transcriptional regulator
MNADEARTLQAQLKAVQRRQRRQLASVAGLSGSAARVLGALARAAAPQAPTDLARDLGMTTSNIAAVLGELETGGYVRRSRNAEDGRRVDVEPTPAGRRLVSEHIERRSQWLQAAVDATCDPAEQETLRAAGALLERIAAWDDPTAARA